MKPIAILSGIPVRADLEAAPVGAFDFIRDDLRRISTVQPIDRAFVERTDIGYRGIIYSKERPFMFALNGSGFVAKPLSDDVALMNYCTKLEESEQSLTSTIDANRADKEQDDFNLVTALGSPDEHPQDGAPETLINHGPAVDVIERIPGTYQKMLQGGARSIQDKKNEGVCGGGVVMNDEGKILLVKPRNGHGGYDWTFPKGYPAQIDEGHLTQTAVREVREETGYRVFAKKFIGRFHHNDGGQCDYFECDVDNSKQVGEFDQNETEDIRWCSLVEALELLNDDVDVKILSQANQLMPTLLIKGGAHSGTMVALHLPLKTAKQLAVLGGENPKDMHITLGYLGKDLTEKQKKQCAQAVRMFAKRCPPIKATLGGVGRFSASASSEGRDVVYLSVDSPDITRFRQMLLDELLTSAAVRPKADHGFVPHVTLAYIDKKDKTPLERFEPIELTFDSVSLTIADKKLPFRFEGKKLLFKSTGEGSRGGHVVGHTKTGKPVYQSAFQGEPIAPSRESQSDEGYVYHATNLDNAHQIAESGLHTHKPWHGTEQNEWPDGSRESRSYWSTKAHVVHSFAPEGRAVMLRAKHDDLKGAKFERGTGDVVHTKKVHPSKLEIHTNRGWEPLSTAHPSLKMKKALPRMSDEQREEKNAKVGFKPGKASAKQVGSGGQVRYSYPGEKGGDKKPEGGGSEGAPQQEMSPAQKKAQQVAELPHPDLQQPAPDQAPVAAAHPDKPNPEDVRAPDSKQQPKHTLNVQELCAALNIRREVLQQIADRLKDRVRFQKFMMNMLRDFAEEHGLDGDYFGLLFDVLTGKVMEGQPASVPQDEVAKKPGSSV